MRFQLEQRFAGPVDRVMDGDLDGLIKAALVARARGTLAAAAPEDE